MNVHRIAPVLLLTLIASAATYASPPAELCRVLRAFAKSVPPGETRELTFRTSWGTDFKDATGTAIFAKRCEHGGYSFAQKVCAYLMQHGSIEFTGETVKDSISCFSRKTRFDPFFRLNEGKFSFSYGTDHRGARIDISFGADKAIGGMAFLLVADGY